MPKKRCLIIRVNNNNNNNNGVKLFPCITTNCWDNQLVVSMYYLQDVLNGIPKPPIDSWLEKQIMEELPVTQALLMFNKHKNKTKTNTCESVFFNFSQKNKK